MAMKREEMLKLLENKGFLEIKLEEGKQLFIQINFDISLERWNGIMEDWETVYKFPKQEKFNDLISKIKMMFDLDIK